ncbi:MAG: hypothetical protein NT154_35955 [Verrucomicrobia bacterium]|nr:hypothetical protein [Verrucomicrobiota bacterium]
MRQAFTTGVRREMEALFPTISSKVTVVAKIYGPALQHLVDLRDLAVHKGEESDFSQRLAKLHEPHARKPSFAGLLRDRGI